MPPKGWRKNAEGQYPTPNRDSELTSIDDILFPRATVQKIAKQYITDQNGDASMMLAKESVQALQRSATVFVSHILHHARQVSKESTRKTVSAQDIITALERTEFSGIIPEVKLGLNQFEASIALKKKNKAESKAQEGTTDSEPVNKKLKVENEDGTSTPTVENDNGGDEEAEEEEEENEEEVEEVEEAEEKENPMDEEGEDEEEEDEIEVVPKNPHQVLEAEYVELEKSQE